MGSFFFDGFDNLDLRYTAVASNSLPPMLIPDVLPLGEPGLLVGDPSCGKSEFAQTISVGLSLGLPVLGLHIPDPVPVVYLALEGSKPSLMARIHRISREVAPEFDEDDAALLDANLHLLTPSPFSPIPKAERLENIVNNIARLSEKVRQPGLVVIDTLSHLIVGDENHADSAREPWEMAQAISNGYGWTVIMIHHLRKVIQGTGAPFRGRGVADVRGSSAHTASARFVLGLSLKRRSRSAYTGQADPGVAMELKVLKWNDGPEDFTVQFRRDPDTGCLKKDDMEVPGHNGEKPSDNTKAGRLLQILQDPTLSEEESRERSLKLFRETKNPETSLRSAVRHLRNKGSIP
ncbi:AAA family ATPase [Geothrix campi]|uniref:AAA family ATPase n=1 Tax=Geothrix campi TaxID=2966450 RepID=UPI002147BC83|nr:AAA family ATPase [Geothrix sp. SG10]